MSLRLRLCVLAITAGSLFAIWCLATTTALSMTLFFMIGLPLYGLGVLLYVVELLVDLRRHRVL